MELRLNEAVPAILKRAKSYDMAVGDEHKIALAFKELYPQELERRKALPGYTPRRLLDHVMEGILEWARGHAPDLFRHIQRQRYISGGMREHLADRFTEGELAALARGEHYSKWGDKL